MKNNWKGLEKTIASIFDTQRSAFSGSNSGVTHSDSYHQRLYIENKNHKDQAVLTLMRSTEELAKKEGKLPLLALSSPEHPKDQYIMFNVKDLFKVVKEIDIHEFDKRFPDGTTIEKLMETSSSENKNLYEVKEQITIEIKRIMREKVIGNDQLEDVKTLSTLLYFIDSITDYLRDDQDEVEDAT
jgi:hypothetical protein